MTPYIKVSFAVSPVVNHLPVQLDLDGERKCAEEADVVISALKQGICKLPALR